MRPEAIPAPLKTPHPELTAFPALLAVTASASTATTTPHGRTFITRARNVDRELAPLEFLIVEHLHGLVRIGRRGELDKGKAPGFACEFVQHEVDRTYDTSLGEILLEFIFHRLVREVPYEESRLAHNESNACSRTEWGNLPWQ